MSFSYRHCVPKASSIPLYRILARPREPRATIFTSYCAMSLQGRRGRKKKISFREAREREREKEGERERERKNISHSVRKDGNRIAGRAFVDVYSRESTIDRGKMGDGWMVHLPISDWCLREWLPNEMRKR